ncbi:hypothetical protein Tco_1079001 [Tanacetum coccineum]|uniref:Uncharacterized protein n=1 Tax=Tanacetum coccineum TaxID=301880 RepID=A0ABQ5HQL5_9ASTR
MGEGSAMGEDEAVNEEPSMQLKELMDFCTKLQQRVLDLENKKNAQAQEIISLKLRVKRESYKDEDMFGVHDLDGDELVVGISAATISNVKLTLAQTLAELKSARHKTKGVVMQEPKKKDQIKFDEEESLRLQAKFDEKDRLAREKAQQVEESNIGWDDIQANIDADYQLAKRLQA